MKNVKAVLVDREWFQFYDNKNEFTEKYVASGMYWNYFYNVWKTVSSSPFSNAIVFVTDGADVALPTKFNAKITNKSASDSAIVLTVTPQIKNASIAPSSVHFVQTEALTSAGIAVHPYGAVIIPSGKFEQAITLVATINGTTYTGKTTITSASAVGATVEMDK